MMVFLQHTIELSTADGEQTIQIQQADLNPQHQQVHLSAELTQQLGQQLSQQLGVGTVVQNALLTDVDLQSALTQQGLQVEVNPNQVNSRINWLDS